ncbi:potassium voltage-gated channel subfamily C member 1 isoform X1 [Hydra vulgaris]|uniref:potassium voltage-gated channel subfamily C member 1 isoform X1 n=1 Tax=Hydra vulgaris TaxID=6087 RepID=UPI0006416620|nr:potassium voltage-gated channel subfamily C member 1-like isoform X1 [Hydra vulgaris]
MMNHEELVTDDFKNNIGRIIINVGGSRHECYISTIQNFPDTRLFWIAETALAMENLSVETSEFFFDRHPGCFENILNYCRTGRLHCPKDVCGPLFQEELEFWGVDEMMMQPCCWPNYSEYREVSKNLKLFEVEEDELLSYEKNLDETSKGKVLLEKLTRKISHILPPKSYIENTITGINIFIVLLSIVTFCLSTEPLFKKQEKLFNSFEIFYCIFFSLDLILRIGCCPSMVNLFKEYLTWFDIISILPFYYEFVFKKREIGFLLLLRLLRIFRLPRYFKGFRGMIVIGETLKASFEQLLLLILVLTIPMVVFATMVYYAEKNSGSNFESIPRSFWWAIITLTTVGYGDMSPTSLAGKIIGGFCASFGILVVALPISIIGSNFSFYYSYAKAKMELPKHESKVLNQKNQNQRLKEKLDGDLFNSVYKKLQSVTTTNEENNAQNLAHTNNSYNFLNFSETAKSGNTASSENKVIDNCTQTCKFNEEYEETSFQLTNNKPSNDELVDDEYIISINAKSESSHKEKSHKKHSKNEHNEIESSKIENEDSCKVEIIVPNRNNQMKFTKLKTSHANLEEPYNFEILDERSVIKFDNQINTRPIRNRSFTTFDQSSVCNLIKNHRSFTTTDETTCSDSTNHHPRCSVELNKLNHENKQVIHLDIVQYQPKKITNRDRANIRRKLVYRNTIHR